MKKKAELTAFIARHKWALIVLALLLIIRLMGLLHLGLGYTLNSDDSSYIYSGIDFARTGMITMHDREHPSAQIMPGMTVLIGLICRIFGEGRMMWVALKLLWICMGTLTAWFVYRCVRMFAPTWCAVIGMLPFFRADMIWMDNIILTETPYMLALTATVYYTLKMAKEPGWPAFWRFLAAYMAGLMFKANIVPYPLLALLYLLLTKYDRKLLLRQYAALLGALLCFMIPWSVRNYVQFHAFIPLTYGSGNANLLGTYQGVGYPSDEILDYDAYIEPAVREKYAEYFDESGEVKPEYRIYVSLERDGMKAAYRQKVWAQTEIKQMALSYLYLKPKMMINSVFYWNTVLDEPQGFLILGQRIDLWICMLTIAAAFILKKNRKVVSFIAGVYLFNIYLFSMAYAFDRYNASLMSLRFILVGIGSALILGLLLRGMETVLNYREYIPGNKP